MFISPQPPLLYLDVSPPVCDHQNLNAAAGNNLQSFSFSLLPSPGGPRYDFIEIRDGTSETADVLGRHCNNIAPAPIVSSGPSLQIRFVSDYAHQGAGFSLRYEVFRTGEGANETINAVVVIILDDMRELLIYFFSFS